MKLKEWTSFELTQGPKKIDFMASEIGTLAKHRLKYIHIDRFISSWNHKTSTNNLII